MVYAGVYPFNASEHRELALALEKLCLDALVQLVCVRSPDSNLPRPLLEPLSLSAPALLPYQEKRIKRREKPFLSCNEIYIYA